MFTYVGGRKKGIAAMTIQHRINVKTGVVSLDYYSILGIYRGCIGIVEKKMETIMGYIGIIGHILGLVYEPEVRSRNS